MAKEILAKIISNFNVEDFIYFFRQKNPNFISYREENPLYNDEDFEDALFLGEIPFSSAEKFLIYSFRVKKELSERLGKKAQYEKAKRIIKEQQKDAGIFIFYDKKGKFRFSLVYPNYVGQLRKWSSYWRFTYFVSPDEPNRTFLQRIGEGDFSSLEAIKDAFSVEKVTNEFYEAYRYALREVILKKLSQKYEENDRFSFAQLFLSRMLFLYFLQKKGWFKWKNYEQDKNYIKNLWLKYKTWKKDKGKNNLFYQDWLKSLFFGAFNKKSRLMSKDLPEEIRESFLLMPFLNGGLFSETEFDKLGFELSDSIFEWLFEPSDSEKYKGFLEIFNFTIDEASPLDAEVAVDPEMLGKVYESLIAEEERGSSGIFYTPRIEIDFMCRLSLVEFLFLKNSLPKSDLIDIVFYPPSISNFDVQKLKTIKSALDTLKVLDPACGSGSFLLGMMNILLELHAELTKKIEKREENLFALKQKIILENLYGVDVKRWAVMVAELRLWLSLIIDTDEKSMNIYTSPLLPNLSFKIRQGDSLVEEIGGVQVSLRGESQRYIPKTMEKKLRELMDKKTAYFSGQRSGDLKEVREIEELEQEIFKKVMELKIKENEAQINQLKDNIKQLKAQKNIFGEEDYNKKELKLKEQKIFELKADLTKYKELLKNLNRKVEKDYFLWEVDFAEVFAEGGFDVVIGNPPYVRQEIIAPPLKNPNQYSQEEWKKLKDQYKEKLIASVKAIWKDVPKIDKKSDLYVYFYYHALSLLKEGGIFCFINSNSWLDVGYGAPLQEFLLKNMKPLYIIDNLKMRSFKQADVNTVVVLIERPKEKFLEHSIKFVAFKKPFEEVVNPEVIKKIEEANKPIFDDEDFRIYPKTNKELLLEGSEIEKESELKPQLVPIELPYVGNKWGGKYLRAPEIYFKILEKGQGKLVKLGDIARVISGIITGDNKKYYIPFNQEHYMTGKYLKVFKSPKDVDKILITADDSKYLIRKENRFLHKIAPFLTGDTKNDKFIFHFNKDMLVFEHKFIGVDFNGDPITFVLSLNATFVALNLELMGKSNLGQGALYLVPFDLNQILIAHPFHIQKLMKKYLMKIENLLYRPIHSIFTELGFDRKKPIREQEPNPLPDRKALDDIVFDALGLTEEERKEVYWAVAELVKNRLEKSKSV